MLTHMFAHTTLSPALGPYSPPLKRRRQQPDNHCRETNSAGIARPSLSPGSQPRTMKRTEGRSFLEAEEEWKRKCLDAGVDYIRYDPNEDVDATQRRRDKMRKRIAKKQNNV